MSSSTKPRRISDAVVPGKDFAEKVKIAEILDRDVLVLSMEKVEGSPEFSTVDEGTGEVVSRDYWNLIVQCDDHKFTFSTGAVPINKVLTALQAKIDNGEAEWPLLATFRKEGRTYVVE